MGIKQLYNDNLRKLPNKYGDVSVMFYAKHDDLPGRVNGLYVTIFKNLDRKCANEADKTFTSFQSH